MLIKKKCACKKLSVFTKTCIFKIFCVGTHNVMGLSTFAYHDVGSSYAEQLGSRHNLGL